MRVCQTLVRNRCTRGSLSAFTTTRGVRICPYVTRDWGDWPCWKFPAVTEWFFKSRLVNPLSQPIKKKPILTKMACNTQSMSSAGTHSLSPLLCTVIHQAFLSNPQFMPIWYFGRNIKNYLLQSLRVLKNPSLGPSPRKSLSTRQYFPLR